VNPASPPSQNRAADRFTPKTPWRRAVGSFVVPAKQSNWGCDRDVTESSGHLDELCLQQSAGDSTGPQLDVASGLVSAVQMTETLPSRAAGRLFDPPVIATHDPIQW